jgi:hypothetical protein
MAYSVKAVYNIKTIYNIKTVYNINNKLNQVRVFTKGKGGKGTGKLRISSFPL